MFVFFQAEDGIRDGHVTGVQTCALPIFGIGASHELRGDRLQPVLEGGGDAEIGRASCRERGKSWEGGGGSKKKRGTTKRQQRRQPRSSGDQRDAEGRTYVKHAVERRGGR